MKFAIFGNTYQPKKSLHALRLFELLKKQGAEILANATNSAKLNELMKEKEQEVVTNAG